MHIKRSGDDLFTLFLRLIAENQRLVAETDEDNKVILSIINPGEGGMANADHC